MTHGKMKRSVKKAAVVVGSSILLYIVRSERKQFNLVLAQVLLTTRDRWCFTMTQRARSELSGIVGASQPNGSDTGRGSSGALLLINESQHSCPDVEEEEKSALPRLSLSEFDDLPKTIRDVFKAGVLPSYHKYPENLEQRHESNRYKLFHKEKKHVSPEVLCQLQKLSKPRNFRQTLYERAS